MKHILTTSLFLLVLLSCTSHTQTAKAPKTELALDLVFNPNHYDEIGFACGGGGQGTMLVKEFTQLVKDKNYQELKENLYSSKPGAVYLATVSCEKLVEEEMIKLNEKELEQIEKNRSKTDTIYTCSGCTESEYYTVKQLLNDSTGYEMKAKQWFDGILGKNIIEDKHL